MFQRARRRDKRVLFFNMITAAFNSNAHRPGRTTCPTALDTVAHALGLSEVLQGGKTTSRESQSGVAVVTQLSHKL